jgi:ABC-type multidrug transport system fused ATPase/permease subunit
MTQPSTNKLTYRDYLRFFSRYLRGRTHLLIFLGIALFTNIALQIINPQIMRSFLDTAMAGGNLSFLQRLAGFFIGIAVVQQLIGVLTVYITENLGWAATNDVRLDLARYTLGLDMSFHTSHTPGEMIERIDGDVMSLSNFFSQFILQVFGNAILIFGILIVLIRENWLISLSLGVFVAIAVTILLRMVNFAVPSWEEERQASAALYGFLEERLSGTEDIRSNNAVAYVLDRFYRLTRDLMRKTLRAVMRWASLANTTWVLFSVGNAIALIVGAYLYRNNSISLGSVFMIVYYSNMINWPLERITQQFQDLQKAGASLVRIMGIQKIQGKIPDEANFIYPDKRSLSSGPLEVAFEGVTFGYGDSISKNGAGPAQPYPGSTQAPVMKTSLVELPEPDGLIDLESIKEMVLCNIDFTLKPGRILGLLGRTGSGKTTITRLLFRLYDPDEGSIQLGGRDLRDLHVKELRRSVGMVTQNIQLFHATVRENLTFFDGSIPDERVNQTIKDLGLWDWFSSLPKGLDTELESGGGGLSAGEAQLLAFTRIFLRDPGLIILDEATSRLDPATEHLIEQAVDKLVQNRTAIIVAHRLGTVERADDILIIEDGEVCEFGERKLLASDPDSRFYHLLETGMEEVLA